VKAFAAPGYLLGNARVEVRLVYTGFLLLTAVGLVTVAVFQLKHVGPGPDDIAAYYRGGERAGTMMFAKTFRELVELTHFHAFIMGVVYLVLAHLFIATTVPEAMKRALVVVGFVGLVGDLVGVWLIRYVSAGFSYPQAAFWLAEWVGFAAFVGAPLHEMWFRRAEESLPPE
jgi:hypothetical protein